MCGLGVPYISFMVAESKEAIRAVSIELGVATRKYLSRVPARDTDIDDVPAFHGNNCMARVNFLCNLRATEDLLASAVRDRTEISVRKD